MIASAHIGAGLVAGMVASRASGSTARRVAIALLLGLASHVMLDAVPHADYGFMPRRWIVPVALCEAVVVFAAAWMILRRRVRPGWQILLVTGVFGATVPDSRFGLGFLGAQARHRVLYATYWFHSFFHAAPVVLWIGMTTQVAAALACMAALFAFPVEEQDA